MPLIFRTHENSNDRQRKMSIKSTLNPGNRVRTFCNDRERTVKILDGLRPRPWTSSGYDYGQTVDQAVNRRLSVIVSCDKAIVDEWAAAHRQWINQRNIRRPGLAQLREGMNGDQLNRRDIIGRRSTGNARRSDKTPRYERQHHTMTQVTGKWITLQSLWTEFRQHDYSEH